ncbi:MAG: hypothetical protein GY944_23520 [bacterium]|nr:hypothetical protein [bacterium]
MRQSVPRTDWTTPSNALDAEAEHRRFRVTHPFHPLFGREYELIQYRHFWGEDRIVYVDESGGARSLPARWTSAVAEDPVVVVSAGRSHLRVVDLGELVKLVRGATP